MAQVSANQSGKDGVGIEKTLIGPGVRLVAKELTTTRTTTLRVTGLQSGATFLINVVVKPGGKVNFYPPATNTGKSYNFNRNAGGGRFNKEDLFR